MPKTVQEIIEVVERLTVRVNDQSYRPFLKQANIMRVLHRIERDTLFRSHLEFNPMWRSASGLITDRDVQQLFRGNQSQGNVVIRHQREKKAKKGEDSLFFTDKHSRRKNKFVVLQDKPVVIVADTHGDFLASCTVLQSACDSDGCLNPAIEILNLGDYVDRGPDSLKNLLLWLLMRMEYSNITLLRGNHEASNGIYDTYNGGMYCYLDEMTEVDLKISEEVLRSIFDQLPICAQIQDSETGYISYAVHGGPPYQPSNYAQAVGKNNKVYGKKDNMLWNDICTGRGRAGEAREAAETAETEGEITHRRRGVYIGDRTAQALQDFGFNGVFISGHCHRNQEFGPYRTFVSTNYYYHHSKYYRNHPAQIGMLTRGAMFKLRRLNGDLIAKGVIRDKKIKELVRAFKGNFFSGGKEGKALESSLDHRLPKRIKRTLASLDRKIERIKEEKKKEGERLDFSPRQAQKMVAIRLLIKALESGYKDFKNQFSRCDNSEDQEESIRMFIINSLSIIKTAAFILERFHAWNKILEDLNMFFLFRVSNLPIGYNRKSCCVIT